MEEPQAHQVIDGQFENYPSDTHWDNREFTPLDFPSSKPDANIAEEAVQTSTNSIWTQEKAASWDWFATSLSANNYSSSDYQENSGTLQQWAYETSHANMTIAERFEKKNWETERRENL